MDNSNANDAVKSLFTEMSVDNLEKISGLIKAIGEADRVNYLRAANPPSSMLLNVYNSAKQNEEYEVCASIKALLLERGIQIP
jgi:hypothetical protein